MSDSRHFMVIGSGLAGARGAIALRESGFDGRLTLCGEETVRPYDRVPLSKQYLRGEPGGHTLFIKDRNYYPEHDIDLRLDTRAVGLDVQERRVTLGSGERVAYDGLLLATGAAPRRLTIPGSDLDGVYYLRTLADADRLRQLTTSASRLIIIGAGWIGCEVAASARQMGIDVALVELAELPLERALGRELGRFYRDLQADHGVELHLGVGTSALRGRHRVEEAVLTDGHVLAGDAVVVGIGAMPRTDLAKGAGLDVDNGILVDEHLATAVPGVFAVGDVARPWHPGYGQRIRLEHWSSALEQGPVAAKNMLGQPTVYDRTPFFFSDQYDVGMEYRGRADYWDQVIIRGDLSDRKFIAFWLKDGIVQAGMNVNVWNAADDITRLVEAKRPVDVRRLANPSVDLGRLIPAAT